MKEVKKLSTATSKLAKLLASGKMQETKWTEKAKLALSEIYSFYDELIQEFNTHLPGEDMQIRITQLTDKVAHSTKEKEEALQYLRFWFYAPVWAISIRASKETLEVFLQPTSNLLQMTEQELPSMLKLRLGYCIENDRAAWSMDGHDISEREVTTLLRSVFKDMIVRSGTELNFSADAMRLPIGAGGESLSRSVKALVDEKFCLSQKIVSQQEEIQRKVARELNDAVISDIMILKRSLTGDKRLSDEQVIEILDRVTSQIYDICDDLTPRDLQDWGLHTVASSLIERLQERTKAVCTLTCPQELPRLPEEVELNIYRIVQESLNNIEKYAQAKTITVLMLVDGPILTVSIEDDGQGFTSINATPGSKKGGRGGNIMRERAALIRLYYPTRLFVQSSPQAGTKITLELQIASKEDGSP